jgi:uncharacterized protein YacL
MNTDQLKSRMASLPEEDQDAFAQLALMEMKKRSRLEHIASGSMWIKLGLFIPLFFSMALLPFRVNLADVLPIIIVFLLSVIYGLFAYVNSRIDAVYELMKTGQPQNKSQENQDAEHAVGGNGG